MFSEGGWWRGAWRTTGGEQRWTRETIKCNYSPRPIILLVQIPSLRRTLFHLATATKAPPMSFTTWQFFQSEHLKKWYNNIADFAKPGNSLSLGGMTNYFLIIMLIWGPQRGITSNYWGICSVSVRGMLRCVSLRWKWLWDTGSTLLWARLFKGWILSCTVRPRGRRTQRLVLHGKGWGILGQKKKSMVDKSTISKPGLVLKVKHVNVK